MRLERRLGLPAWFGAVAPVGESNLHFGDASENGLRTEWETLARERGPNGELDWILTLSGTRRAVALYAVGHGTTLIETARSSFVRAWAKDGLALMGLDALGEESHVRLWTDNTVWRANWGAAAEADDVWQRNGRFARVDVRTQTPPA